MHTFDRKSRSSFANSAVPQTISNGRKAKIALNGAAGARFDFARIDVMPPAEIQKTAKFGTSGPGGTLPYIGAIQRSFGHHSVSTIRAHTDEESKESARAMGANAFTTGEHIAFAGPPSLRIAAHEAAHVVQQRAGVQVSGGLGRADDPHERHAHAVAGKVVRGESSEALLDCYVGQTASGPVVQRDENRPTTSHNTSSTIPGSMGDYQVTSDPYAHSLLVVLPGGSGVQYVYETVRTADGKEEEKLIGEGQMLEPIRVQALIKMNATGAEKAQEDAAGSQRRRDADVANLKAWEKEQEDYKAVRAAYQAKIDALPPGTKPTEAPPPAPKGLRPGKTTKCTDWPAEVYQSAGGNAKQSFTFTPPKNLPGWRSWKDHKEGPKPGDIYWLWDIALKRVAHMGVFKSATPVPGHPNLQRWVVNDGGQGTYEGIQMIKERSRTFDTQTGIFKSNLAEAGQDKGDRELIGWIDIVAQNAAKPPEPSKKKH